MKRYLAVLLGAVALAACSSAQESAVTSTDPDVATSTSTSTTLNPDASCPSSASTSISNAIEVKRVWVETCDESGDTWAIELRSGQWLSLANTGTDLWIIDLGTYHVEIQPGETVETPPAGTFLKSSLTYGLDGTTTVEMRDVTFGPLDGEEILLQRIGPVGPGQTLGEVIAAARHPVDLDDTYEDFLPDCATGSFRNADGLYMLFAGNGDELRLQYIEITQPGLATRSGIEVGDTADEVIETYGAQVEYQTEAGSVDGQNLVYLPQNEDRFGLVFLLDGTGMVRGIRIGLAAAVRLMEACA
ncbi:MAG: hypothetical protein HKO03_00975 [Acidimicrobiia bacterium]|nr:hypothetical protein [Acidimicrobiia bacterium]